MESVETSVVIQVDMQVSRFRPFPEDGMVEVWGHVGDYEVCVFLPLEVARARGLVADARKKKTKNS